MEYSVSELLALIREAAITGVDIDCYTAKLKNLTKEDKVVDNLLEYYNKALQCELSLLDKKLEDKYIDAGLNTYAEVVEALESGEHFFTEAGSEIYFDSACSNPFKVRMADTGEVESLGGLWWQFKHWKKKDPTTGVK